MSEVLDFAEKFKLPIKFGFQECNLEIINNYISNSTRTDFSIRIYCDADMIAPVQWFAERPNVASKIQVLDLSCRYKDRTPESSINALTAVLPNLKTIKQPRKRNYVDYESQITLQQAHKWIPSPILLSETNNLVS